MAELHFLKGQNMNRKMDQFISRIPLLGFTAMLLAWFGRFSEASGGQAPIAQIDGFAGRLGDVDFSPESIVFEKEIGGGGSQEDGHSEWATLEWGKTMLREMERPLTDAKETRAETVNDLLAFRDWCAGALGGGNLALAISAEEVAVELMFRELADGHPEVVWKSFSHCQQNAMTPDYWLDTLALEGIEIDRETVPTQGAAEYLRMKAVFNVVNEKCAGAFAHAFFPATNWPRQESLDEFNPYALMWRTIGLEDKKVALATCLAIQKAIGSIPEEREEFRRTAENCADDILRKRERLTSWTTAYDVWNYWVDALDAVKPEAKPRRSRR